VPGFGEDLGEVAVEVFFCLSGFLICRSLQKSPGWARFAAARLLRIFPNLALVLALTSASTFLWYRNYPNFGPHFSYVVDNLLLFVNGVTQVIPGVFTDAPRRDTNDPLWTLPYELWLYVMLAAAFVLGVRWSGSCIIIALLALSTAWTVEPQIDDFDLGPLESFETFRLGSYFMSGALLAMVWRWVGGHAFALGGVGLIACLATRNLWSTDTVVQSLALAAGVIGLGSSGVMAWFARGGDASYGMYVFAWPVQQFVLLLIAPFWLSLLVAFLITATIGYATWHTFEERLIARPRQPRRRAEPRPP
jgi:peptidoglycan/LPS O-acetylase OafA/YrhL